MGREGRRERTEMLLGDSASPSGGPMASWSVISDSRVLAGLLCGGSLHTSKWCQREGSAEAGGECCARYGLLKSCRCLRRS